MRGLFDDFGVFDSFDRDINNLFKQVFSNFNRPVKDMQPYKVVRKDGGIIFVLNTLGISRDDLTIEIANKKGDPYRYLNVKGTTEMEKIDFSNKVDFSIRLLFDDEIKKLAYEVKDGLTIIYMKFEEPKKIETVEARLLEEDEDLGF
jgi:HSP20 family molecular chaperone IbpA